MKKQYKHLKEKDFDSIKKLLSTLTIQQTANVSGRSRATVQFIKHSETFKDYKAIRGNYDLRSYRTKQEKIMAKKDYKMTGGENVWYYIINIFTWGSLYFIKTAVKKALSEQEK